MTMIIVFDKEAVAILHVGGAELSLEEISNITEKWMRCNVTDGREVTVVAGYPFSRSFADACAMAVQNVGLDESGIIARLDAALDDYERLRAAGNN